MTTHTPDPGTAGTRTHGVVSALLWASLGVVSTLLGMAAAHLVAALLVPSSSPVLAVGSTVIDLTPTPMKEWAIRQFGTADKLILVGSVILAVLVLAGVAGVLARRRLALGAGLLVLLVTLAAVAAMLRPTAGFLDLLPSLVAAVTGVLALTWLHVGPRPPRPARPTSPPPRAAPPPPAAAASWSPRPRSPPPRPCSAARAAS